MFLVRCIDLQVWRGSGGHLQCWHVHAIHPTLLEAPQVNMLFKLLFKLRLPQCIAAHQQTRVEQVPLAARQHLAPGMLRKCS
jgi:hypothetical protein